MDIVRLLKMTVEKDASDLHLCSGLPPMVRVNGQLGKLEDGVLNGGEILEALNGILPKGKNTVRPLEDLDVGIEIDGMARFRTNVYFDNRGVCVAFRFIPHHIKSLEELGLPEVVNQVCHMKRGLVIVTGITGSGKSTTLASIIDKINNERHNHIITLEDPIEFLHENKKSFVNQREIGVHTRSFLDGLRGGLREDPDVILVGEMRDLETISMVLTAAETGHLVLATLHTRGAAQSIDRIIDVFPSHQQEQIRVQLADVLEMVVSQVLLTSLDGYKLHLASEVMVVTPAIRHLIRIKQTHQIKTEIQTGRSIGMQTLEVSLKWLIESGKISKDAALPWVSDRKFFEKCLEI